MQPYEICHAVFDAFRGLPEKLSRINSLSAEIFRSHGRQPKTENPDANGNVSPVTHFMRYCEQYEAVEPGAGMMLSNRVFAELETRFRESGDYPSQKDLHCGSIDEAHDVQRCLASIDLENASARELKAIEGECDEVVISAMDVKSKARAIRKEKEMSRTSRLSAVG
jgi:hypothetical protein